MTNLAFNLNGPAHFFTLGPVSISVGNFVVISVILGLFLAAVLIPFPDHDGSK